MSQMEGFRFFLIAKLGCELQHRNRRKSCESRHSVKLNCPQHPGGNLCVMDRSARSQRIAKGPEAGCKAPNKEKLRHRQARAKTEVHYCRLGLV